MYILGLYCQKQKANLQSFCNKFAIFLQSFLYKYIQIWTKSGGYLTKINYKNSVVSPQISDNTLNYSTLYF